MDDKKAKNPFQVLDILKKEGFDNVYFVVGGDRVPEFKRGMKKYTTDFKKFEVISAGERDPDAEGVVGMSGSKMRKAAADDEFEQFLKGVPNKTPKRISLKLFKAIRKGMGLKEEFMSFGEQTFDVRLADTDETRAKGLMNVKSMSDDDGMFFVFEEENYHGIWMKNTYIPLDVVWINESGTIVDIATLNPHDLNTRMPSKPAKYVLEVNAGTFGGKVGDKIGSVQLDERYRRQDVYAIVNRKGKVVAANLTKKNAHKEVTRHRDSIIVLDPDAKEGDNLKFFARESVELNELSKEARRKMARAARRTAKRRSMKRKIKARKMKSSSDLMKKARKSALTGFKKKMLKGRSWSSLGFQEKEAIEKRLKKKYKPARIARVAQKMLPGIRKKERERIANLRGTQVDEQFRLLTEPDVLDSLVKKLKDKNPSWSDSKAYAIATASLQKRGILKKGTHDLAERNYKLEYANYQGKPEQIAKRSSRNKARRKLEAQGRVSKGDGKDVDHKDRNPLNNGDGNLRVRKKEHNRSFSRIKEQNAVDRVKEKHKRENERIKAKHDREIDVAKERELASKTRERALRRNRIERV